MAESTVTAVFGPHAGCGGETMSAKDGSKETDKRPEFECRFDPDTGDLDEKCVREYLERNMPLAV
jgi:hypothetical protein